MCLLTLNTIPGKYFTEQYRIIKHCNYRVIVVADYFKEIFFV